MNKENKSVIDHLGSPWPTTFSTPYGVIGRWIGESANTSVQQNKEIGEETNERFEVAKRKLKEYTENLPYFKYGGQFDWPKRWDDENKLIPEKSLRTLFPRKIETDVRLINRTLSGLKNAGIETREELASKTDEELRNLRNIGPKGMTIIRMLKDIISADEESVA